METLNSLIEKLPENRQGPIMELRNSIIKNLDENITEIFSTDSIDYYLPLSIYPNGDPCNSNLPYIF